MRNRFHAPLIGLILAAAALAAGPAVPARAEPGSWLEHNAAADKILPQAPRANRPRNLDFLFGALQAAPDDETAKAIEQRIWALWVVSRSDTANLLMLRVRAAVEGKDSDLAIKLLDGIVKIKPDYIEAWNRRATLYYLKKDYGRALADIREVLKREPRHFGAYSGLGMIRAEMGENARAVAAFELARKWNPHIAGIDSEIERLKALGGDSGTDGPADPLGCGRLSS